MQRTARCRTGRSRVLRTTGRACAAELLAMPLRPTPAMAQRTFVIQTALRLVQEGHHFDVSQGGAVPGLLPRVLVERQLVAAGPRSRLRFFASVLRAVRRPAKSSASAGA